MRRFFFDLLVGNVVKIDPGGMVFEHARATFVVADEMAKHLFVWRDDLRLDPRQGRWRARDLSRRGLGRECGEGGLGPGLVPAATVSQLCISAGRNGVSSF